MEHFGLSSDRYQRIQSVFARFAAVEQVLIFGSRASGSYRNSSDLDLAVKGKAITQRALLEIHAALDALPYGYHYDLLHYDTIHDAALLKQVQLGQVFYVGNS